MNKTTVKTYLKIFGLFFTMCFIATLFGVIVNCCGGCTQTKTVPDIVVPNAPSIEGNEATSGLLYQITDGGFIISKNLKQEYNVLLKKYHEKLNKTYDKERGCTPVYIITDEVMHDLLKMKTWEKNPWLIEEKK